MMRYVPVLVAVAAVLCATRPALADAIDGNWCHDDGRRLSIRGPEIVTPGGLAMHGDYTRHAFTYAAPAGEPEAGQIIHMLLLNENTVRLQIGSPDSSSPGQIWRRCSPSIS